LLPQRQRHRFELKEQNEPKINPRHPVHYTLSWIACVNNYCNFHYVLKIKYNKYPRKTEWDSSKQKFQNAKKMHKWHPTINQNPKWLTVKLKKFITKECLNKYQ